MSQTHNIRVMQLRQQETDAYQLEAHPRTRRSRLLYEPMHSVTLNLGALSLQAYDDPTYPNEVEDYPPWE